jgi:hypothetical protein
MIGGRDDAPAAGSEAPKLPGLYWGVWYGPLPPVYEFDDGDCCPTPPAVDREYCAFGAP